MRPFRHDHRLDRAVVGHLHIVRRVDRHGVLCVGKRKRDLRRRRVNRDQMRGFRRRSQSGNNNLAGGIGSVRESCRDFRIAGLLGDQCGKHIIAVLADNADDLGIRALPGHIGSRIFVGRRFVFNDRRSNVGRIADFHGQRIRFIHFDRRLVCPLVRHDDADIQRIRLNERISRGKTDLVGAGRFESDLGVVRDRITLLGLLNDRCFDFIPFSGIFQLIERAEVNHRIRSRLGDGHMKLIGSILRRGDIGSFRDRDHRTRGGSVRKGGGNRHRTRLQNLILESGLCHVPRKHTGVRGIDSPGDLGIRILSKPMIRVRDRRRKRIEVADHLHCAGRRYGDRRVVGALILHLEDDLLRLDLRPALSRDSHLERSGRARELNNMTVLELSDHRIAFRHGKINVAAVIGEPRNQTEIIRLFPLLVRDPDQDLLRFRLIVNNNVRCRSRLRDRHRHLLAASVRKAHRQDRRTGSKRRDCTHIVNDRNLRNRRVVDAPGDLTGGIGIRGVENSLESRTIAHLRDGRIR